jgi:hypothetical protein
MTPDSKAVLALPAQLQADLAPARMQAMPLAERVRAGFQSIRRSNNEL